MSMYNSKNDPEQHKTSYDPIKVETKNSNKIAEEIVVGGKRMFSVNPLVVQETIRQNEELKETVRIMNEDFKRMIEFINKQQDKIHKLEKNMKDLESIVEGVGSWHDPSRY